MKKMKLWSMAFLAGVLGLTSCSEEHGDTGNGGIFIPEPVYQAFEAKYPDARHVSWKTKNGYAVASFQMNLPQTGAGQDAKSVAWFSLTGAEWGMSEYEIPFTLLPDTIRSVFFSGPYGTWSYDHEVDVLCRPQADTLYVIEAEYESGSVERSVDLYYTSDAVLVKEIIDADSDDDYEGMLPQVPSSSVTDWLQSKYPGARVIDIELEDGQTEVEFVFDGNKMEAYFAGNTSEWLYTKTEYSRRDFSIIPPVVLAALKTSEHYVSLEQVDDVDFYETAASGNYYRFELETRFDDVDVFITEDGSLVSRPNPGTGGGQVVVGDSVQKLLDARYPEAVVVSKEYDDGYLEVTVRHEGTLKEVLFNGRGAWVRTEWEVAYAQVPGEVIGFMTTAYGYKNDGDEIDVVDAPDGLWYEFEVENRDRELKVLVYADGTLKGERAD